VKPQVITCTSSFGTVHAADYAAGSGSLIGALSDIPSVELSSSSLLILFVVAFPGGVLVVVRAGFQAAMEDADKVVGELAQRGVVAGASPNLIMDSVIMLHRPHS
jgi:hypothetical protein